MRSIMKKILTVLVVCGMLTTFTFGAYASEHYSSTGYRTGNTGTIFLQNHLQGYYEEEFEDAIKLWNTAGLVGRNFVVNTQSDSEIYSMDFSESSDPVYVMYHNHQAGAVTNKWSLTIYCTCHTTVMFEIICNDGMLEYATDEYQTAVIVHELGHTLGLVDYPDSYKNKSIMSYQTEIDIHYAPFPMDVKNANDCWAPHLT